MKTVRLGICYSRSQLRAIIRDNLEDPLDLMHFHLIHHNVWQRLRFMILLEEVYNE